MIKNKFGFSLAEVLISIGIVATIATLGFTATKKNLERAYDLFVYTGASSLALAIENAHITNKAGSFNDFCNSIRDSFNAQYILNDNTRKSFTASNNITYYFSLLGTTQKANGESVMLTKVTMTVPTTKKNAELGNNQHIFYHVPLDPTYPTLFPQGRLSNRSDLITYVIDTGENNNQALDYYSFRQAACRVFGGSINVNYREPIQLTPFTTSSLPFRFMNIYAATTIILSPTEEETDINQFYEAKKEVEGIEDGKFELGTIPNQGGNEGGNEGGEGGNEGGEGGNEGGEGGNEGGNEGGEGGNEDGSEGGSDNTPIFEMGNFPQNNKDLLILDCTGMHLDNKVGVLRMLKP